MNVFANTWRQLVRRRLWPVALLLTAALAAVPFLLAREPEPVSPVDPAPLASVSAGDEIGEPVVAKAAAEDRDRRRRVLGSRKDPFEPAPTPEPKPAKDEQAESAPEEKPAEPVSSGGGSSAPAFPAPPSSPSPVTPVPAPVEPPAEPKKTYELNSLIVRFGAAETGSLERMNLKRLQPLPSVEEPVLVYLGLDKERKHAIFMVDAAVEAIGDGSCKPEPESCETIHLAKGETEFFDVVDPETEEVTGQYQLDLVDIKSRKTTSAEKAQKAYAGESKVGRKALRARVAGRGPLRWDYDRETGTLRRRDAKSYKAAVARIAARLAQAQPEL
jgi:hypothetical protein